MPVQQQQTSVAAWGADRCGEEKAHIKNEVVNSPNIDHLRRGALYKSKLPPVARKSAGSGLRGVDFQGVHGLSPTSGQSKFQNVQTTAEVF